MDEKILMFIPIYLTLVAMSSQVQSHSWTHLQWCVTVMLSFAFLVFAFICTSSLEAQRLNSRDFFDGQVSTSLERAKEISQSSGKPVFAIIYEPMVDRRPGLNQSGGGNGWALGYFTENSLTREILNKHFVTALVTPKQPGVSEILGNTIPSKPWLVAIAPDGAILEKREIYANPQEGLRIVNSVLNKWNGHTSGFHKAEGAERSHTQVSGPTIRGDKIAINPNPSGMNRAGMLPLKDFVNLLESSVTPDASGQVDEKFTIYDDAPIFATVDEAIALLDLPNVLAGRHEVTVAGWPEKSFFFRSYDIDQKVNDGFNKLTLVTDHSDRLVSIIFLDESATGTIQTPNSLKNWHTFDFVHNKRKLMTTYIIHHEVTAENKHILRVDSLAFVVSRNEAGLSRLVDRARWYLPKPLAAIILDHSERLLADVRE